MMRPIFTLLVLAALVHPAAAQTVFTTQPPGTQPPMPGGRPGAPAGADLPPGTSTIRGRVFASDTGQPLRKAQVRLIQMPDTQSGPTIIRDNKLATTDAQGVFEIKELRAGRYMLTASKGSYVALQYGQARPTEPGKPIQLLDGQTLERVDFTLPRGAIITGRILDEYGEPLSDITISPQRYQYIQGQRRLTIAGRGATTDDLGEFRIFGIPPGQYYLQATWRSTNPIGPSEGTRTGYAPLFYPGTLDATQAQRITVGVGTEMSNIVMTMRPIKTARIAGTALDSQGRPMRGMLLVMQTSGFMSIQMGSPIGPDGTFTLNGLAPGEYTLRAQQGGPAGADAELATLTVTVAGEDITGLQLAANKPSIVRGQIVVDPAAMASLPSRLMLSTTPVPFVPMMGMQPSPVLEDLTFELKAVPGTYRLTLGSPAPGWAVRTVRLHGADVTDAGFAIKPNEDLSGVEVELTNKLTMISGLVTNARGDQLKDYTTVVFAQDSTRWGGSNPRYQSMGRPDQDGRFKVTGLPAGEYYIIALDRIDSGEVNDPEFLERIRQRASTISLNEGETKTMDLKVQAGG
jgi:hypothetical protein